MVNSGQIIIPYGDPPGTPGSGKSSLYFKNDKLLYIKNDEGSELIVSISGTATLNEVNSLIATISGTLSSEIDSDISTHSTSGDHDGRYYTETEVDALTWTESDITDLDKYTQAEVTTISGDIVSQIPSDFYSQSEVDTLITTTSGDIVSQIITDHGSLTGLGDDDHTQYILASGLRAFTSTVSGVDPTEDAHLTTKLYVDTISGTLHDHINASANNASSVYYVHEELSDLGGFETLEVAPADHAESFDSVAAVIGDGEVELCKYVTTSGTPNTTIVVPGTWIWVLWASISATSQGPHYLRAKWYRREQSGTEHYLFTQEQAITSASVTRYFVETSTSGIDMSTTDRLVVKIFAQIGGVSSRTIGYYVEGVDHVTRFNTPVYTSLVSDHGDLTGLSDDDHTQYHTDARGDARYYTEAELDSGQLDNRYYTESEVDNISGSLQTNIDAKPDTLLELTDTPSSYDNEKYLRSTSSGTEWSTVSGGGGSSNHSELNELDYASAGHTGFQPAIGWASITSNYTVVAGENLLVDTTGGGFTITMYSSPSLYDVLMVVDNGGNCGTNSVTVSGGGEKIQGSYDYVYIDGDYQIISWVYGGSSNGWVQSSDPQTFLFTVDQA